MPKASLIISFYNKVKYLELVFAGLKRQTEKDLEVIIADDGSRQENIGKVEVMLKQLPYKAFHIWQPDKGFRKNRILNQAVLQSSSEILIFIDADCIPHRNFVAEHISNARRNVCLTGRRVNLSKKITHSLTPLNVENGWLERNNLALIIDGISGKSFDVEKGFYFKNKLTRNYFNRKKRGLLGCNFSLYKKDLMAINGFDERYEAPSVGEDSDVQFRLELIGVEIKSLNNIAVQYHLYHKLQPRPDENLRLFEKVKNESTPFTPFGIKKNK